MVAVKTRKKVGINMKMARSLARVYTHTHTLTFRANSLAIKNSKAFNVIKNNIKGIEYSQL